MSLGDMPPQIMGQKKQILHSFPCLLPISNLEPCDNICGRFVGLLNKCKATNFSTPSNTNDEPTSSSPPVMSPPRRPLPIVVPPPPPLPVARRSPPASPSVPGPLSLAPPQACYQLRPMVMPPPPHYQAVMYPPQPPPYYLPGIPMVPGIQPHGYTYPTGYLRSWSTGLFDCSSDIRNCCTTSFCPCVTFGQISEIINEGQTPCWEGCVLYGLIKVFCLPETVGTLTGVYGGWYRKKMREKYKLKGSLLYDCLVHVLCEPCALCQEFRELGRYGFEVPLGWKENIEMQKTATAVYQVAPIVERRMLR